MIAWKWPLIGWISCNYGCHVIGGRTPGLDIAVVAGTAIRASKAGRVTIAQWWNPTAGNYVEVDEGESFSRYLHQSRLDVVASQYVAQGQQLGLSGSTGQSDGPHLHWDVGLKSEAAAKALMANPVFKFGRWFVDPFILTRLEEEEEMKVKTVKCNDGWHYVVRPDGTRVLLDGNKTDSPAARQAASARGAAFLVALGFAEPWPVPVDGADLYPIPSFEEIT